MQVSKAIKRWFPLFALPTLLAFGLAFLVPFILGLGLSFTKFTTVKNAKFNGFANYQEILSSSNSFVHALGFTALFTVVSVVTVNFFAFALAMLLTRGIRGTNLFRTVFFMPNLIGGIVLGYIWQLLINAILTNWFGDTISAKSQYGFWGLVVVMNWQMIGYMMIIYIAGIQNVPTEMIEAASIDGASFMTTIRRVIIPMVMPSFTICSFLTMSNSFKLFDQNLSLTAGQPGTSTRMLALDIYQTFYGTSGARGFGQAKAVIFFVLVAVVAVIQLRATRTKEVEG
ncbi:MAG: sugar ABC transporter permease [Bifidobacteriaceae bacterium]|jgi:raffinose/stachyose/melibiose transport system permease protein|nr:sugar ABC transporter permease [Bifidobacteriaceae bacterium]